MDFATINANTIDTLFGITWFISMAGYYLSSWMFFNVDWVAIQKIKNDGK